MSLGEAPWLSVVPHCSGTGAQRQRLLLGLSLPLKPTTSVPQKGLIPAGSTSEPLHWHPAVDMNWAVISLNNN